MSGKSQRARARHLPPGKKRKGQRGSTLIAAREQVNTQADKPAARVEAPVVPTKASTPTLVRYPYITRELWRIGILAGIMVAILVVLALVLA